MILLEAFWLQFQKTFFHKPFLSRIGHEMILSTQNACIRVCCMNKIFRFCPIKRNMWYVKKKITQYIVLLRQNQAGFLVLLMKSGFIVFMRPVLPFSRQPYPQLQCRPDFLLSWAWFLKSDGYPSFHNSVSDLLQSSPGWRTLGHVS